MSARDFRELGELAWQWVLAQVRTDDGPWIPTEVDDSGVVTAPDDDMRDSIYNGVAGLGWTLAEIRLARPCSASESELALSLTRWLTERARTREVPSLYWGLAGDATILHLLGARAEGQEVLDRVASLMVSTQWASTVGDGPKVKVNDLLAGAAGVALAGVWCHGESGRALAREATRELVARAEHVDEGLDWPMWDGFETRMPNYSHGTAGIAAALAVAAVELDAPDLVDAAARGAAHVVALADLSDGHMLVPHYVPFPAGHDEEPITYSWCHGPTGTMHLFSALAHAGVESVGAFDVIDLHDRCVRAILDSPVPDRVRPGYWDNDGQCCGTAGVGDVLLDVAQCARDRDVAWSAQCQEGAVRMGTALVERAIVDDAGARWRFVEHRRDEPLLWPGTGWSQGAAGIAAFLLRLARVLDTGLDAPAVDRPDTWWSLPSRVRTTRR